MEENFNTVNEVQSEVVAPINEQADTTNNESSEVVTAQVDSKPVQDAQTNSMYREMRIRAESEARAAAQKEIDAAYSQAYGEYGIHTKADYEKAVREKQQQEEAQKKGIDPEFYKEFNELKQQVELTKAEKAELQRQTALINEAETLAADPIKGKFFKEWESDLKTMANSLKVDLTTAFLLKLNDNLGDVLNGQASKAEQSAIEKIIKNGQNSPGSVANGGHLPSKSIKDLSSTDFNKLREAALRGEVKEF